MVTSEEFMVPTMHTAKRLQGKKTTTNKLRNTFSYTIRNFSLLRVLCIGATYNIPGIIDLFKLHEKKGER